MTAPAPQTPPPSAQSSATPPVATPAPATLSLKGLGALAPAIARPSYDPAAIPIGIVHFGPGAFFRAHLAAYVDALLARDPRLGIAAVALRSPSTRDALAPQDGLYTLARLDLQTDYRVIGAIRACLVAAETPDRVLALLADPRTILVSATVTEKGYCLDAAGRLDTGHPDIIHDLAHPGAPPRSLVGWLVAGLGARRAAGSAPFDVLSCDNLSDNGVKLKAAVVAFAARRDQGLADWIAARAHFPRTMVDAITPATDDALRARVAAETGLVDAWPIQREAFTQFVIEDDLSPGAPDFASVGCAVTAEVAPYERAKLRLLNGAHSTLAYAGILAGHETVFEAMADQALAARVETMMRADVIPTLTPAPGQDLEAYATAVLARFRNPAIRHLLSQIAWDGSQKLPFRILGTLADARLAGRPIDRLVWPIAAWIAFIIRRARAGVAIVDPQAETLTAFGLSARGDGSDIPGFLALGLIPAPIAQDAVFRASLEGAYAALAEPRG